MKYIVYCTTNKVNNKIYVGVHLLRNNNDGYLGCGVYSSQYSSYSTPKTAFQKAVYKYGPENFERIIIKEFDNSEDAYLLESEIVNKDFLKRTDVYNEVIGGLGGDLAGNAIPCYQYDLTGKFIAEYESQQQASIAVNRGFTTIKRAIKQKIKAADYYWSLEKYDKLDISEYKSTSNKIVVYQYSSDGVFEICYDSVSDAARALQTSSSNISRSCKLGYKCNNKYLSYVLYPKFKAPNIQINNNTIYQYSLDGEFIAEYSSCADAEKVLHKRGLKNAIKLGRSFAGFQWKLEKYDKIEKYVQKSKSKKVGQYTIDGNLIKIYNTVSECTKDYSGCRRVLSGEYKTSAGYVFKYIEE